MTFCGKRDLVDVIKSKVGEDPGVSRDPHSIPRVRVKGGRRARVGRDARLLALGAEGGPGAQERRPDGSWTGGTAAHSLGMHGSLLALKSVQSD